MCTVAKTAAILQLLTGECAEQAANVSGVIKRVRKFTCQSLARTFIWGFLQNPKASDENLAQVAGLCGVQITAQGIEKRFSSAMVEFLKKLAEQAMSMGISTNQVLAPILRRFPEVRIIDSSMITLPESQHEEFSGCGGSYDAAKAAIKLQTELDLRGGRLFLQPEAGRSPDNASSRQRVSLPKGSLRIADLGYFDTKVFEEFSKDGVFWLSRLQFGTDVLNEDGAPVPLMKHLNEFCVSIIAMTILLSSRRRVKCRLLAWRLPQEIADRRRQKLRHECLRKRNRLPTQERLNWCDWTILVSNVPEDLLTPTETGVLYRARWQIELLFKRWKSQGLLALLEGSTDTRQMVRFWSRLLAELVRHWLLVASVWGDPRKSLQKAGEAIRSLVSLFVVSLKSQAALKAAIETLQFVLHSTGCRNPRKDLGTFQLLNDPGQLTWGVSNARAA